MKIIKVYKIEDINLGDYHISKNDELYPLEKEYNCRIERSSKSDAIYLYSKKNSFVLRIGHPFNKQQYEEFKSKYRYSYSVEFKKSIRKEEVIKILQSFKEKFK